MRAPAPSCRSESQTPWGRNDNRGVGTAVHSRARMGTTSDENLSQRPSVVRRVLRLLALASAVLLALALLGYVARDRTRWLALLMYLPMVFVAPLVIIAQLAGFER